MDPVPGLSYVAMNRYFENGRGRKLKKRSAVVFQAAPEGCALRDPQDIGQDDIIFSWCMNPAEAESLQARVSSGVLLRAQVSLRISPTVALGDRHRIAIPRDHFVRETAEGRRGSDDYLVVPCASVSVQRVQVSMGGKEAAIFVAGGSTVTPE
jgi:hypothetical protein